MTSLATVRRPRWATDTLLRAGRCALILTWLGVFVGQCVVHGIAYDRSDLLVWIVIC